mmetsp:Transcript_4496/g.8511  ORF Transcript_4496/g.8511 Transcript_4496/m.8511 type:complete len:211 (-) Transcript_4496:39-671(-)|eukprot:CAMPEP_0184551612 /NCGR_PEP_ID=MMETSP0199_2-20130426/25853_1 /TAXON_ID=1112570 /ORGANISM="Thraustochytrium sp., Strain LLF1b" /LENGTH=210 /DNA_ID=CAMNT_0026946857 /DNA_START=125 /DNA_END=757 /DNA_ORIENTATION=-
MQGERDTGDAFAGSQLGTAADYGGYTGAGSFNPAALDGLGSVSPRAVAPVFGGGGSNVEYLDYTEKSAAERMFYKAGTAYLGGIFVGGAYGVVNGFRTSPSPKFKIRINTILNKSGRYGSKFGNALGAVALMYSCFEAGAEALHLEENIPGIREDFANPLISAFATGLLYKSTQGPRTMLLAGVIGATAVMGYTGARMALSKSSKGSILF